MPNPLPPSTDLQAPKDRPEYGVIIISSTFLILSMLVGLVLALVNRTPPAPVESEYRNPPISDPCPTVPTPQDSGDQDTASANSEDTSLKLTIVCKDTPVPSPNQNPEPTPPKPTLPILENLPQDTQVFLVGGYQGADSPEYTQAIKDIPVLASSQQRRDRSIELAKQYPDLISLNFAYTDQPSVLFLASYESVRWNLNPAPDTKLQKVVLLGDKSSEVSWVNPSLQSEVVNLSGFGPGKVYFYKNNFPEYEFEPVPGDGFNNDYCTDSLVTRGESNGLPKVLSLIQAMTQRQPRAVLGDYSLDKLEINNATNGYLLSTEYSVGRCYKNPQGQIVPWNDPSLLP